jgi:hypothetical protein
LTPARKRLIRVVALCALLAALVPLPGNAARSDQPKTSTVPCWVTLLNDWYDGTISNIYPIGCYAQAIKHLPPVSTIYGSAKEDIIAARQAAQLGKLPKSHPVTTTTSGSSSKGGLTGFLDRLVPGNPNSFPTPLLILGLLAILLILAGVGGMLWQRSHPRDDDESDDGDTDAGPPQLGPGDSDAGPPQLGP